MRRGYLAWVVVAASVGCASHELDDGLDTPVASSPGCEVALADVPSVLFSEQFLLRAPRGIEFVDENPVFAVSAPNPGPTTCALRLRRVMAMVFEHDPAKSLPLFANDFIATLAQQGYAGGQPLHTHHDDPGDLRLSLWFPSHADNPAVELYLAFAVRDDLVVAVVYELDEGTLDSLLPTLETSARSLLRVPPEA